MKRTMVLCAALALLLIIWGASAWAEPQVGNFYIKFDSTLPTPQGTGDGWESPLGERWFFYEDPSGAPWWNTWWYDDRPDVNRWKEIFFDLTIESFPEDITEPPSTVSVAINWSNMQFPERGPNGPPPMPGEEWAIERMIIFSGPLPSGETITVSNWDLEPFIVDYNPEWVSMDVWVEFPDPQPGPDPVPQTIVEVYGRMSHECVPEPSTAALLVVGVLGLAAWGWRKRR